MRDHRWTGSVAIVGALVLLVLTAGVITAVAGGPAPARDRTVLAAGDGVSGLTEDSPPTTPSTATTVATIVPPPTTAAPPVRSTTPTTRRPAVANPTTATTAPPATPAGPVIRSTARNFFGYSTPTGIDIPFSPGRTTWTGTTEGVTITVRTNTASPRVGEPIEFDVELSSGIAGCCGVSIWFGDGYRHSQGDSWSCATPPTVPTAPVRARASHVYNLDGRWTFAISGLFQDCGPTYRPSAHLVGMIEVGAGTSTAQGPSLPQMDIDRTFTGFGVDYSRVGVAGVIQDADGWISKVTVDWGDGSPLLALPPKSTCLPSPAGWPGADTRFILTGEAVHHYLQPGRYTAVVTAGTTGCDGSSAPQTASDQVVFMVPASG